MIIQFPYKYINNAVAQGIVLNTYNNKYTNEKP